MSLIDEKGLTGKDYGIADRNSFGAVCNTPMNTNLAVPTNFLFSCRKVPTLTYFVQEFTLPETSKEPVNSDFMFGPTVKMPNAVIGYGSLGMKFLINEDFSNYYSVIKWMLENTGYTEFIENQNQNEGASEEGTLILLSNKKNPVRRINFQGLIPTELSGIDFSSDVSDHSTLTATVKFSVSSFSIKTVSP